MKIAFISIVKDPWAGRELQDRVHFKGRTNDISLKIILEHGHRP